MDSLTPTQIAGLALEGLLVIAGIVIWFRLPRSDDRSFYWDAAITDTLLVLWAVLFAAFLGQVAGAMLLKTLPESVKDSEAIQVLVIGGLTDLAAIVAWVASHTFLTAAGRQLPSASPVPFALPTTLLQGAAAFLRALPIIVGVGLVWGLLIRALGLPDEQQGIVDVFEKTSSVPALVGLTALATIIVPIAEELVFRAGFFRILSARIGRWPAIVISSTLFSLLHMSWVSFAPLFCLGVVFCLAYERSRNIAVPIIAHGLFNLNSILMIVFLPAEFLK